MHNMIRQSSARSAPATARGQRRLPVSMRHNEEVMLEQLDRRERLRLVEFVCSFAWADFEIQPEERAFIARLIQRLDLDEDENLQVQKWLDRPPGIDHLDPTSIPPAHRRIFVEEIEGLIAADGEIAEEESDSLEILSRKFRKLPIGPNTRHSITQFSPSANCGPMKLPRSSNRFSVGFRKRKKIFKFALQKFKFFLSSFPAPPRTNRPAPFEKPPFQFSRTRCGSGSDTCLDQLPEPVKKGQGSRCRH